MEMVPDTINSYFVKKAKRWKFDPKRTL